MPFRLLMRWLVNNEKTIDKLANSYPIRRAAQMTLYMMMKGKEAAQGETGRKAIKYKDTLVKTVKDEWDNVTKR